MSSKVSDGDSGIATLGPTGKVNGGMVTEFSVEDQHMRLSELGPGVSLGGRGWRVVIIIVFHIVQVPILQVTELIILNSSFSSTASIVSLHKVALLIGDGSIMNALQLILELSLMLKGMYAHVPKGVYRKFS